MERDWIQIGESREKGKGAFGRRRKNRQPAQTKKSNTNCKTNSKPIVCSREQE